MLRSNPVPLMKGGMDENIKASWDELKTVYPHFQQLVDASDALREMFKALDAAKAKHVGGVVGESLSVNSTQIVAGDDTDN